jgi:hypothetical protein
MRTFTIRIDSCLERVLRLAASLCIATSLVACNTPVREPVYTEGEVEVSKRSYRSEGAVVERGYQHPASLELEPLAYALAKIQIGDLKDRDIEQRPAIALDLIAPIARGLVAGFAEAGPDEELVVIATRKEKTIGIFHRRLLTTFIASRSDDHLLLSFTYSDKTLTKAEERKDRPVPEIGDRRMQFRILPGPGIAAPQAQVAKLAWPGTAPAVAAPARASPAPIAGDGDGDEALPPGVASELKALQGALERGEIAPIYFERKRAELLERGGDATEPAAD